MGLFREKVKEKLQEIWSSAVKKYDFDRAKPLIKKINIDGPIDDAKNSAIFYGGWVMDLDFIKLLIDNGADINYKNRYGQSSLTLSVLSDRIDESRFLLLNGANPNIKNCLGHSILEEASHQKKRLKKIIQLLKEYGAKE